MALRYFNVYGPRMDIHGLYTEVLIRWMERIAAGQPPFIFGDGQQTMDFVYTDDIARANLLAAESDVTDEVFNIGSGTETSLLDLAEALLSAMDSDLDRGVRAGARSQRRHPAARRRIRGGKASRLEPPRSTSKTGCADSSTGGARSTRPTLCDRSVAS